MAQKNNSPYKSVQSRPNIPKLEEEILQFWDEDKTFQASIDFRPESHLNGEPNEFVFYDGPPFANGLPHYGHILTGFVKDAIPRFQTMRGKHVERNFGWDCHGLPAEMAAEKELNLQGRNEVINFGVDKFNDYCRSLVLRTTDIWESYIRRQARWVDTVHNYKTMNTEYMESTIWAFKQLYDKGLAYEGFRVLPYCWECETPLSNFETRQDDSYRLRVDTAVTVLFKIDGNSPLNNFEPLYAMVWTTTPWTLPSNLAIAVGPEIDYCVVKDKTDKFKGHLIVAKERLATYEQMLELDVVGTIKGSDIVGRSYTPLFEYFKDTENAFKVLGASFVTTEDGTGIVHLAPGFGEDDQNVCNANGIEVKCPIDDRARFTSEVPDLEGTQVFDANEIVLEKLKSKGVLVESSPFEHSYPHCWRTDTPLVYRALSSWFVAVNKIKNRMLELNGEINWIPEHVRDGAFGKWLEGARDWSISRNRFWGTPIPVWKSDDPRYPRVDVYGSIEELERDFGVKVTELHRPEIDELTRPNPDDPTGQSTMRRISDVLDCWFESGSMPFASIHYPFENVDWFESHFPADFIVEYIGQVRGWFYTLHVLGTALFDRPPFKTCMTHGIVLGDDGRKLSKRLKNYPDPEEVFNTVGSDAMRWFLLSGAVSRGSDIVIDRKGPDEAIKQVISPLWNAWYFLTLYSNVDQTRGEINFHPTYVLDRYIVSKVSELVEISTQALLKYDLAGATQPVVDFLEILTNWYIRRSRDRFWAPVKSEADLSENSGSKEDAYNTLHTVLTVLLKITAPFLPLISESIYKPLTGERSVHLCNWPELDDIENDRDLVKSMDLVREVCSLGHSIRKANNLRARLPLASITVASKRADELTSFIDLIKDELNIKDVLLSDDISNLAIETLDVVPSVLGPRLGKDTQKVIKASKNGEWTRSENGALNVGGIELNENEATVKLVSKDSLSGRVLSNSAGVISLDINTTPELISEGLARDLVRIVQNARRDANFVVTDRIHLQIFGNSSVMETIKTHHELIASQVLASKEIEVSDFKEIDEKTDNSFGCVVTLPDFNRVGIHITR